ncbi:protein of unknown function (plasmid) [Pararobbsia alpina]
MRSLAASCRSFPSFPLRRADTRLQSIRQAFRDFAFVTVVSDSHNQIDHEGLIVRDLGRSIER